MATTNHPPELRTDPPSPTIGGRHLDFRLWYGPQMASNGERSESTATHRSASTVSELIRRFRRESGLTQEELADRAGVSTRTISDLERGVRATPQAGPATLIADALELAGAAREEWFAAVRDQRLPRTPIPKAPGAYALPVEPPPMLGREADLLAVETALSAGERLITLLGPGGVGKTRLAIDVALRRQSVEPGAVVWVGLESLTTVDAVLPAIARACRAREGGGSRIVERIAEAVAYHPLLMIIDNAEHLLSMAPAVLEVLAAAPGLSMVITSREALRVSHERIIPVDPLPLPHLGSAEDRLRANPAVALYLRALGDAHGPLVPSEAILREASEVVHLVDGVPLAIELAAAQAANLPAQTITQLLETAGLAALAQGRRDGPDRFLTMDAAIAWSLDRLPADATRLLLHLGAFHGGFTTDAVGHLTSALGIPEVLRQLPALVNAQLIQRQPASQTPRLRLLEPIRMFARQELIRSGQLAATREAHATWYLGWANAQIPTLSGRDPLPALNAIEQDLPNLRAAVAFRIEHEKAASTLPVLCGLARFFDVRGYRAEHRAMLDAAIASAGDRLTGEVLEGVFWSGYHSVILGDESAITAAILRLQDYAAATGHAEWSARADFLQWGRAGSTPDGTSSALLRRGIDELGDDRRSHFALMMQVLYGIDLHERGEAAEAVLHLEAACTTIAAEGRALDLPVPLARLGLALLDLSRDDEALPLFIESMQIAVRLELAGIVMFPLLGLTRAGARSLDLAQQELAAIALGAVEEIVLGQGLAWGSYWEGIVVTVQGALANALGDEAFDDFVERGHALSIAEVLAIATSP